MKARQVRGRRIVGIEQARFWNSHLKRWCYDLHEIILDSGDRIILRAQETQETPSVDAHLVKLRLENVK